MNKEARLNLLFFGIFLFAIIVLSMYITAQTTSVFGAFGSNNTNYTTILGRTVNEDVGHIYNITINHTVGLLNVTNVTVFFWGNFNLNTAFYAKTIPTANNNMTGNVTENGVDAFAFVKVWNSTDYITWNATNTTSYLFASNRSYNGTSWFWFNATANTPGTYNMTVIVGYNLGAGAGNRSEHNITVTINDTTTPQVTLMNLSVSNDDNTRVSNDTAGNYHKGTVVINASGLSDNGGRIRSVFFNLTNSSSGNTTMFYKASNATGSNINWNYTLDTTKLPDGNYTITVWANDSNNNVNKTSKMNITIDNTVPTGSVSCTPANVHTGDTVTCTCTPSDGTSGINTSATSVTANPSTTNTGTYTETCTFADKAGNSASSSDTYTVELSGSGGSSSGSSGSSSTTSFTYSKTIPQTSQDFSEIKTIETSSFGGGGLKVKERVKIKLNEEEHYIGVRELTANSATIEITSDPIQVKLEIGEDAKVDIDDDGVYDVYVKLNGITGSVADLTINYLQEEIPESSATTGEEVVATGSSGEKEEKGTWLWVLVIALILLAIIVGAGIAVKKKK